MTSIEWTDATWNPIVGCSIVSPGCTNCYAMKMAARLEAMGTIPHYAGTTKASKAGAVWTGKLALAPEATLLAPLRRRKPTMYFVNSMGDLFHEDVPDAWIDQVFAVMALAPQHTFQILTKRSARMRAYMEGLQTDSVWDRIVHTAFDISGSVRGYRGHGGTCARPLPNVWLGVSAEDQRRADERVPDLLATPAAVRFVSAEPLLGAIDFRKLRPDGIKFTLDALTGLSEHLLGFAAQTGKLDWIIAGGESGPGARPMHLAWPRSIRDQCAAAGTAFFFKQWGEFAPLKSFAPGSHVSLTDEDRAAVYRCGKKCAGRRLDGVEHNAMPGASHE